MGWRPKSIIKATSGAVMPSACVLIFQ